MVEKRHGERRVFENREHAEIKQQRDCHRRFLSLCRDTRAEVGGEGRKEQVQQKNRPARYVVDYREGKQEDVPVSCGNQVISRAAHRDQHKERK